MCGWVMMKLFGKSSDRHAERSRSISTAQLIRITAAGEMLRLRGRQMSMTFNFEFPDFLNSFIICDNTDRYTVSI